MRLSRIEITNFRNFRHLDVSLAGNAVIVGENRVGKSNLLYALRLIFDPTLPDSARQLTMADFWDGLTNVDEQTNITVSVEIRDFESDLDVLAVLTDHRLDDDPSTVRLTYLLRPRSDLGGPPANDDDLEFVCFGGESEAKRFGHSLRRRITMDLLPALRDAEGDLAVWRRSPLRPLLEDAVRDVDTAELADIASAIEAATATMMQFQQVGALESAIATLFREMSGSKQDVQPTFGFAPTDAERLHRQIRLLIDGGKRGVGEASLGSANLIFLTLTLLHLKGLIANNRRDHTLLAIEEPEAHLHPHLQRLIYKHLFEASFHTEHETSPTEQEHESEEEAVEDEQASDGEAADEQEVENHQPGDAAEGPLSIILTTHSPHIASVAPITSLLLLRDDPDAGTVGRSTASLELSETEENDLARYLDVTRAEMVFARGVILVEGDAERFLVPEFAKARGHHLDDLGITVCSVAGTNFQPYAKLLTALGIPFSIITDWDPGSSAQPRGYRRGLELVRTISEAKGLEDPDGIVDSIDQLESFDESSERFEAIGIFTNSDTLEVELFEGEFAAEMIEALREANFGPSRTGLIDQWEDDPTSVDKEKLLAMIDAIGKGRFAQRLATSIGDKDVPAYINGAIDFVINLV